MACDYPETTLLQNDRGILAPAGLSPWVAQQSIAVFGLMRQSLPRPSGRLVPVATSSVRLVGSTVTERLCWLAERDPETLFRAPG